MKKNIDLAITILCGLIILIAASGLGDTDVSIFIVSFAGIGFSIFLFSYLSALSADKVQYTDDPDDQDGAITELLLMSEENKPMASWDMFGKSSLVIGRDIKENHVDINLSQSVYASMIDIEHAVLNYSGSSWYIEDIGSKNGIVLIKVADGRKYKLAADQPCKIDKGDTIIIGLTKLKVS